LPLGSVQGAPGGGAPLSGRGPGGLPGIAACGGGSGRFDHGDDNDHEHDDDDRHHDQEHDYEYRNHCRDCYHDHDLVDDDGPDNDPDPGNNGNFATTLVIILT
jgi:hypothetical protein